MKVFDYVNNILYKKQNVEFDENFQKEYIPFLINRALSYHYDCVLFANEMNQRHFLDKKLQNDFLMNTIRSRKRPFVEWMKNKKNDDIDVIKKYFNYSSQKALQVLNLLTNEQIEQIREKVSTGGPKNTGK